MNPAYNSGGNSPNHHRSHHGNNGYHANHFSNHYSQQSRGSLPEEGEEGVTDLNHASFDVYGVAMEEGLDDCEEEEEEAGKNRCHFTVQVSA